MASSSEHSELSNDPINARMSYTGRFSPDVPPQARRTFFRFLKPLESDFFCDVAANIID